jgi:xanthine dehydrogenase YagS FAD-binding subunit
MKPFSYARVTDHQSAIQAVSSQASAKFIAGGTNLVDLMKEGVEQPDRVVDITRLPLDRIEQHSSFLRLGALARNADTANSAEVRRDYPLLAQAILAGASGQLRNAATNGGNLLQRTRCYYFYDVAMPCNKRRPGSGCSALEGYNRIHAILGASEQCVAVHPSDMCVALAALEALVQVEGPDGARSIPFNQFHRLPGSTPDVDTNLEREELVTAIDLPADAKAFRAHSHYLKVRDRASYAFALVSVAAALEIEEDRIVQARVVLGGVSHKPWRSVQAEGVLTGARIEPRVFEDAAQAALQNARPLVHNGFKVELAKRAIVRALSTAAEVQT